MMSSEKKLIRNSTAEFLIFTTQAGEQSIEARYADETVWLTQKLMAELFAVDVRTVNEHLKNVFSSGELSDEAVIRKSIFQFRYEPEGGKISERLRGGLRVKRGSVTGLGLRRRLRG